jgi:hypothetical protein
LHACNDYRENEDPKWQEIKNKPEPPQMVPKGMIAFNLPYEKAQPVCCWQKDRREAKSGQKVRNML